MYKNIKKTFIFISFLLFCFSSNAHIKHYNELKQLRFDLYRNNNFIGTHIYTFSKNDNKTVVESIIDFEIKKFGIVLYKHHTKGREVYDNGVLISFNSETVQNKKNKFCNIVLKESDYFIEGSSYTGKAPENFIIGTWWNHQIIDSKEQISAISGRIIKQKVTFLGKEKIQIDQKKYNALHFNFSSTDKKLSKDKKLNTDVWYAEDSLIWLKATFKKKGFWEYRLINIEYF